MPTVLCLIRHGQTAGNQLRLFQGRIDTPLNETGRLQITRTAHNLKMSSFEWNQILSSPLSRAKESAQIIHDILEMQNDVEVFPDLIERSFGVGELSPITPENYDKIHLGLFKDMETESMMRIRANRLIDDVTKRFKNQSIIALSHSHTIKAILKLYDNKITYSDTFKNGEAVYIIINDDRSGEIIWNREMS